MDINNQFDQELLSAYLDDGLSAAELAQVETWLASDPTAVSYLNDLRSNRHTLKAMANLPGLTLKSSLSDRVLAQIHSAEPHTSEVRLPTITSQPNSRHWWAWGTLAATAAAVTWFAVLPLMQPSQSMSFVPTVELPAEQPDSIKVADQPHNAKDLLKDTLPGPAMPGDKGPTELVGSGNSAPNELQGVVIPQFQILLIADVMVKETAWDAGKFDKLLEKFGIQYDKELVAKPSLVKSLIESQVTVGPDADPSTQQDAALVYVDSPAKALDDLLLEIENDSDNFVGLNYQHAMGGTGLGAASPYDSMLSALRKQTGTSQGRGIARLILPEGPRQTTSSMLPAFEVPVRNTDAKLRGNAIKSKAGNLQVGNSSGEALFILRKQSSK